VEDLPLDEVLLVELAGDPIDRPVVDPLPRLVRRRRGEEQLA
jgi:hypothetical protein